MNECMIDNDRLHLWVSGISITYGGSARQAGRERPTTEAEKGWDDQILLQRGSAQVMDVLKAAEARNDRRRQEMSGGSKRTGRGRELERVCWMV